MGCAASLPRRPERVEIPVEGVPAWRSATIYSSRKGDTAKLRFDGTKKMIEATLLDGFEPIEAARHAVHPERPSAVRLRIDGRVLQARLANQVTCARGQRLLLLVDKTLTDATVLGRVGRVGNRYKVRLADGRETASDLNAFNHSAKPHFDSARDFAMAREALLRLLVSDRPCGLGIVECAPPSRPLPFSFARLAPRGCRRPFYASSLRSTNSPLHSPVPISLLGSLVFAAGTPSRATSSRWRSSS